jgi:hypothetical protein
VGASGRLMGLGFLLETLPASVFWNIFAAVCAFGTSVTNLEHFWEERPAPNIALTCPRDGGVLLNITLNCPLCPCPEATNCEHFALTVERLEARVIWTTAWTLNLTTTPTAANN